MHLVIVSGRSGSGKSIALKILEDCGYYCIDNLPLNWAKTPTPVISDDDKQANKNTTFFTMQQTQAPRSLRRGIFNFVGNLPEEIRATEKQIAVSIDIRNFDDPSISFEDLLIEIKRVFRNYQILYLDADDDTIIRRYSETRRKHPLTSNITSLREAIKKEKEMIHIISENASLKIDTSNLNTHQLEEIIKQRIDHIKTGVSLLFQSFGFKFGIPKDADFIFDVRCLPNPYWQKDLRSLTGADIKIAEYLESFHVVHDMYQSIRDFLEKWIPNFQSANRQYLTISIGCTGGQHRSVYLVQRLAKHFLESYPGMLVRHRNVVKNV